MITNKSVIDEQKNLKFNKDLYKLRMPNSLFWAIVCAVLGVGFIVCAFILLAYKVLLICLGVLILLLSAAMFFLPLLVRANSNKTFKENAKNSPWIEFNYVFENDMMTITDAKGNELASGGYDNLIEAIETPHAFYIMVEQFFGFIIDKDGFIEGDECQLRELFKAKIHKFTDISKK